MTKISLRTAPIVAALSLLCLLSGCPRGVDVRESGICEGYTFINYPSGYREVINDELIDLDGNVVHKWPNNGHPGRMLPGGSSLGAAFSQAEYLPENEVMSQISWDGVEEWRYTGWDLNERGIPSARQHHDWQREGNPVGYYAPGLTFVPHGKTLVLAHEGRVLPQISDMVLYADVIYEIDWEGNQTGFVWHSADHFEDFGFDEEAIRGMRLWLPVFMGDLMHMNSISELGQNRWYDAGDARFKPENIIWSSRNCNIIAIISRETGEIVWQLGPEYGPGTMGEPLGPMIGMHHAHMIPAGLPGAGNVLVFDNGGYAGYGGPLGFSRYVRDYTRVVEFNPVTLEIVWQYGAAEGPEHFFSIYMGSAQRLPNGNTLITDGDSGHVFEVTPEKETVWSYTSTGPANFFNHVYRAYRVPPEWLPEGINPAGYTPWAELYEH